MSLDFVRTVVKAVRNFGPHYQYESNILTFPELGVGWYPVNEAGSYDDSYFDKFESYKSSEKGKAITRSRVNFVSMYIGYDPVVDIGSGACDFVDSRPKTYGYDVSDYGRKLLKDRGKFVDIDKVDVIQSITCWDSLEHIPDCWKLIEKVQKYVFVSIPIVASLSTIKESRHFKPREHYWYFTYDGLTKCFKEAGFQYRGESEFEVENGRKDIGTFAFKRV